MLFVSTNRLVIIIINPPPPHSQPFQLNRVLTKCLVQYLKDYKLNEPEDPEVTVYICDSR